MSSFLSTLGALLSLSLRLTTGVLFFVVLGLFVGVAVLNVQRDQRETRFVEELAPKSGIFVSAEDANIFLQQWGPPNGPLLVLVHGTGAWSGTWFELPATLAAAGWHVVAVDLPPFGLSSSTLEAESVDYTRAAQARRLRAVLTKLGGPVTLVAHSFGAGPALEAALQDSTRLRQLVLVDPALGLGPQGQAPQCTLPFTLTAMLGNRSLRNAVVGSTATVPAFSAKLLQKFVHRKQVVTPALIAQYQAPFGRVGFSAAIGDWAFAFANSSCEDAVSLNPEKLSAWAATGVPVSLLWGAEDTITPLAQAASLSRWIPQANLSVVPDVGHIPHIEDPHAFAQALLAVVGTAAPAH